MSEQREKHPNFVDTFGRVQLKYGDMSYACGCAVTGSQVTCVEHRHIRPALSAQPCGCDLGASHICEWHASHGLSLPTKKYWEEPTVTGPQGPAVPVVSREQRANAEQARVKHQTPSPDTFVDTGLNVWDKRIPVQSVVRKTYPVASGVLDYFPLAVMEVARVSYRGNEQHNPGQPLHWDRSKSQDQADCLVRHLLQRGTLDTDGMRHSAKVAWRALALLQLELEAEGK